MVTRAYRSFDGVVGKDGPFGHGWHWSYGVHALTHSDGSVTLVEGDGTRTHYWSSGGALTPGQHVKGRLERQGDNTLRLTRLDNSTWLFEAPVSGRSRLRSIQNLNGDTQTLSYDGNGRVTGVTAPGGRSLTVSYTAQGRISQIAGPEGLTARYEYDANGNLTKAADASATLTNPTWMYTYDARHQLTRTTDGEGRAVQTTTPGTLGRLSEARRGGDTGPRTTLSLPVLGAAGTVAPAVTTDPLGVQVRSRTDAGLNVTEREVYGSGSPAPLVQRLRWEYNGQGDATAFTDGNGRRHTTEYDARGLPTRRVADAAVGGLQLTANYSWDPNRYLLGRAEEADGRGWETHYDGRGNPVTLRNPMGQDLSASYDGEGRLTQTRDATGRWTDYRYNAAGDVTTIIRPANGGESGNHEWRQNYDTAGRVTSVTDPLNQTTSYTRDGMGRVLTVTDARNGVTRYTYDRSGRPTRTTDALGRHTDAVYNTLGELSEVRRQDGGTTLTTAYGYDARGQGTSVTDARGKVWGTGYDALGQATSSTDPLTNARSTTYDANGRPTLVRRADGVTTRRVFDAAGRQTGVDLTNDGTLEIEYTLDRAGRLTEMRDATGVTRYTYDLANRVTRTTVTPPGGTTQTVEHEYDAGGRLASLLYPSGRRVSYAYTNRGELGSVTNQSPAGGPASSAAVLMQTGFTTSYRYNGAGQLIGLSLPNGIGGTLAYNPTGQLTNLAYTSGSTPVQSYAYAYNALGQPTQETQTLGTGAPTTTTYGYNGFNQLTSAAYGGGPSFTYGYNATGQRTSLTQTQGGTTTNTAYTVNDAGRISSALSGGVTTSYGYNANGSLTSKQAGSSTPVQYSYNPLGQLVGASGLPGGSGSPTSVGYGYNGLGQLVTTTSGGTTTQALHAGGLLLNNGAGQEFVWGKGLVSQSTTSGQSFALPDGRGNVASVADAVGAVLGRFTFDRFGRTLSNSGPRIGSFGAGGAGGVQTLDTGLLFGRVRVGAGGLWEPDLGQPATVAERASLLGMDPADYAENISNQIAAQLRPSRPVVPGITRPLAPSHPKAGLCNDGDILCLWFDGDEVAYQHWLGGGKPTVTGPNIQVAGVSTPPLLIICTNTSGFVPTRLPGFQLYESRTDCDNDVISIYVSSEIQRIMGNGIYVTVRSNAVPSPCNILYTATPACRAASATGVLLAPLNLEPGRYRVLGRHFVSVGPGYLNLPFSSHTSEFVFNVIE